ncbi:hypothetical protein DPMN_030894 [Dreissena polymorpha]|uniref:Hexosyltransferase n=1 Tax=Dreissena polymorpha TaxID=45954 RepID=A0A9D4M1R4_DREPO|nr:hypothetical protein DPMN_030894 [Dreissena polymorpha]
MGLSWVANSCLDVKFVLNTNDETMVDPFHMVYFLELRKCQENADLLYCSTFYDQGPERNPSDKFFVTYKEFPYDRFPPHCDGFAYIISYSTAFKILEAAKETPFFWLDVVFVTGLLALKAAITHTDMPANHTYNLMQLEHIAGDIRSSMFLVAKIPALRAHWIMHGTVLHR